MNIFSWFKKYYLSVIALVVFFIVWEIMARLSIINPLFIGRPTKIFSEGMELIVTGEIIPHFLLSMKALLIGFGLAIIVGVGSGLIIASNKTLYKIFYIFILGLNSFPMIAIVPLVIIWFGIGIKAETIIVFLMTIKPILINTIDGVNNVDKGLVVMAKSFGAKDLFILKTVTFFSILPFVFSSLRIAIGKGIVGLIVGESFGFGIGLGFLISFYGDTIQTTRLMFVILILLFVSLSASGFISMMEKRIIRWR